MLFIFLLNVVGYYGVFVGLQKSRALDIQSKFDQENYNSEDEVLIKFPLTVPYVSDSREYTRVDGEFEHQGEVYRLVKQRYTADTLFIVCVKDDATREIKRALTDYVKTFSDTPSSEKNQSKTTQNLIKDFIAFEISLTNTHSGWMNSISYSPFMEHYESIAIAFNSPPPLA